MLLGMSDVAMPRLSDSMEEGTILKWLKADGASVKTGEPLFELETDKASNEIPAPSTGILKIGVAEGTTVEVWIPALTQPVAAR